MPPLGISRSSVLPDGVTTLAFEPSTDSHASRVLVKRWFLVVTAPGESPSPVLAVLLGEMPISLVRV
jgi:hypothetical protein